MKRQPLILLLIAIGAMVLPSCNACREKYFDGLEKVGVERRELLVDRIEKARNSQEKAQEQFKDALQEFKSVVDFDGGDLEAIYNKLEGEFQDVEKRVEAVHERIRKVRNVGKSLFSEWEQELGQYESSSLRAQSESELKETRKRYEQVLKVMETAEARMEPVLSQFRDRVLFLKHNLNAKALGSLQDTTGELETEIGSLIEAMETSIREADLFIDAMGNDS